MKLLGGVLIVVSLVAASISASVAYHVSVDSADDEIMGLTLQDEQDLVWMVSDNESASPSEARVVTDDQKRLTSERIQMLRDRANKSASRSSRFVRVREFALSRWPAKWIFLLALAGMVGGALLQRSSARPSASKDSGETAATPQAALKAVAGKLNEIVRTASDAGEDDLKCRQIILAGADELQKELVPAFVDAYPRMVAELGMGRAAENMDVFSAAERSINRAWSAACDGAGDEAMGCIVNAQQAIDEMTIESA